MENNFKGTQEKVYDLQFGSVMFIQDDDYYEANNILDIEDVGEEVVKANVKLITDAFNIRQQINCDLSELLDRYNEAFSILKTILEFENEQYSKGLQTYFSSIGITNKIEKFLNKTLE